MSELKKPLRCVRTTAPRSQSQRVGEMVVFIQRDQGRLLRRASIRVGISPSRVQ